MSLLMDLARRQMGGAFDALGLGPEESPFRIAAVLSGARLKAYGGRTAAGPVLLIIPAPFKRAYIWDLTAEVSVIRKAMDRGLRVYVLEWDQAGETRNGFGLEDYAERLPLAALGVIRAETGQGAAILAGHSLGGTFAAIFAALHPEKVEGLVLVDAPLAFGAEGGPLGQAARGYHRMQSRSAGPVSGSLVNALSLAAAPEVFFWQRTLDFAACLRDPKRFALHMRMERWSLDESPMPSRLFDGIVEQLYRDDRFMKGTLQIGGRLAGCSGLRAPVIAVVNPAGRVVPPRSILRALESVPGLPVEILTYEADCGPMLQHLGPLVSPLAHRTLWPKIMDWIGRLRSVSAA